MCQHTNSNKLLFLFCVNANIVAKGKRKPLFARPIYTVHICCGIIDVQIQAAHKVDFPTTVCVRMTGNLLQHNSGTTICSVGQIFAHSFVSCYMIPIQTKSPVLLFIILLFAINWICPYITGTRNFLEPTHDIFASNECTKLGSKSKFETNIDCLIN